MLRCMLLAEKRVKHFLHERPVEKSGIVRDRLKEAGVQSYEPTNRNSIQDQVSG